jgi:Tol biopolymer transport system component
MKRTRLLVPLVIAMLIGPVTEGAARTVTTMLSVAAGGGPSDGASDTGTDRAAAVSSDGRYVAFTSDATNLVAGDTNGVKDVFVRDTTLGTTTRASVGYLGQADGPSTAFYEVPAISANGRFVAFSSEATNLVPGDTNGVSDVFVRDMALGITTRVSVGPGGQANGSSNGPAISANGRYVVFFSDATDLIPIPTPYGGLFIRDRKLGTTELVSRNGSSAEPSISAGGRYVAFTAILPPPYVDIAYRAVYVYDRKLHVTKQVSVGPYGEGDDASVSPSISGDGRFVAFESSANNLVPGDTNLTDDVFVRDTKLHVTKRISVGFIGQAFGDSASPSISADGRFVAFMSWADDLVPWDLNGVEDVFLRDRQRHRTILISVGVGSRSDGGSWSPGISADGRFVAFMSFADNLVPGDTNGASDVFIRGPLA